MRAFGVLGFDPVNKRGDMGVLLPGLLLTHAMVSAAVVLSGRSGFERTVEQPGGPWVVVAVAVGAWIGGLTYVLRAPSLRERVEAGLGLMLPVLWLWAVGAEANYDALAGLMSATWLGEQGEAWFPGLPVAALGYTFALFLFGRLCTLALKCPAKPRYEKAVVVGVWLLTAISLAGVVHWATGW